MIRIQQVKLPLKHTDKDIIKKACKMLHIKENEVLRFQIKKQSIDARKKTDICYVYTIDIEVPGEDRLLAKAKSPNILKARDITYTFPQSGTAHYTGRPVVVGSGPAGLFCAYALAEHGYHPLVIERGRDVDKRSADVEQFWNTGALRSNSNVQFGEGGAGTFSDGKLNTLVKDPAGRNRKVLELFVSCGAPEEILYVNKPHIGTDILKSVVKNLREKIITYGGEFAFETQLTDLNIRGGRLCAIELGGNACMESPPHSGESPSHAFGGKLRSAESLKTDILVLAAGHSARDTFEMLWRRQLTMEVKSFAVGLRVEHPQSLIDDCQYKDADRRYLPAASYKLTANLSNGRSVYSFCMCPGGYVVNASSEEGRLAVNGMSYHRRDGKNANSAIIVSVTPKDYKDLSPLAGVAFQRQLEESAYKIGGGKIPQQLFGDFAKNRMTHAYGTFDSAVKGSCCFANLRDMIPDELAESFVAGMHQFAGSISAFDRADAILSGIESRTSSPVRIVRDENFESNIAGIYPCGEGAGYAGGIMSAAMDGLKVAEAIAIKYKQN